MLTTVLAHIAALVVGYIASVIVNFTFGVINVALAGVIGLAASWVLLKRGVSLENVERLNKKTIADFFFITGFIEGIVKILLALVVFRWFEREMGWPMVLLFVAFQLIPFPSALGERHRGNMRGGSVGAIVGLIVTWLVVSGAITA